jgi:hypothetical protein
MLVSGMFACWTTEVLSFLWLSLSAGSAVA